MGDDVRLEFSDLASGWRAGTRQHLQGSDYVTFEPFNKVEPNPTVVEIEIAASQTLLCGPMTRIQIKGTFESKAAAAGDWEPVVAADAVNVIVAPGGQLHHIREIALFHGNQKLITSDEGRHVAPYLDAYLYAHMNPLAKKLLCPQACHPANGVPTKRGGWKIGTDEWTAFAKNIFTGKALTFDYIPLHFFPFFQRSDFLVDNAFPSPIPLPVLGKLTLRITFNDDLSLIFAKKADNTKLYRFAYEEIRVVTELARLQPTFERQFYTKKSLLPYAGVTRLMLSENITSTSVNHKCKFQNIPLPEGLFIFALPKKVIQGSFSFQENTDGNVFSDHKINAVQFSYGGQPYYLKEPNMSMITNDSMEVKQLLDHLSRPPFNMKMDPKTLTLASIEDGAKSTAFPHVYLNFCNYGPGKNRLIPLSNDGSILAQKNDLELNLQFSGDGAPANTTYMLYAFYSDVNLILDMRTRTFHSPYLTH